MANLSLTLSCNRACEYCFASDVRTESGSNPEFMPAKVFLQALEFLKKSGISQVRLLGGEPTLHPQFVEFLEAAQSRDFSVMVFSNGLMRDTVRQKLAGFPPESLSVLINAIPPSGHGADGMEQQRQTLAQLGPLAMLGINIDYPNPKLDFLLYLIVDYKLKPAIRVGLAHPAPGGGNRWLRPKHYRQVGEILAEFREECARRAISLEYDCGFVPCMFPGFEDGRSQAPADVGTRCNPILDLLPDGTLISCYPLAGFGRVAIEAVEDGRQARSLFGQRFAPFKTIGVFPECCHCRAFREKSCVGGCRAAAMTRLRPTQAARPINLTRVVDQPGPQPETRGQEQLWVVPYIDQPPAFWDRLADRVGRHIKEVYFPLPVEGIGSGRPVQPSPHFQDFLEKCRLPKNALINPIVLPQPVEQLLDRILESVQRYFECFGVGSVTLGNLTLVERIRERLPDIEINASVLMDIFAPNQALLLNGAFDTIVPSSRIVRDLRALRQIRQAFTGKIRLIVNEGCLPGCLFRTQHFFEMAGGFGLPRSLCAETLEGLPWLRLTGAWILPQHLHYYEGVYDELKLAGRVTLQDPARYETVLESYVKRRRVRANEIGAGPASVLEPIEIDDSFFEQTLECGRRCDRCHVCEDYWQRVHSA
jgi:MoaA/NifB/PqqE/SkfB family radical SAM enzyme